MALGCNCNAGLSNTGRPGCVPLFSVVYSLILVPLYDNDGNRNGIDLTAGVPVWNDLVNEADASKRWFPLPGMENVEVPKADSQFEEANSGRMAFLRQGKRSLTGEMWGDDSTTTFLGKLQGGRCVDFGVYIVDVNDSLIGSKEGDFLYPIPVDNASWNPIFNFATDSTVQKIVLSFDWYRLFDDSTMYMITSQEAGTQFSLLRGLIDVTFADLVANETTDTIVFNANTAYGTAYNPVVVQGILVGEVVFYNETTTSTLTPTLFAEGPAGAYTATFADLDINAGDIVSVTLNKTGFVGEAQTTVII